MSVLSIHAPWSERPAPIISTSANDLMTTFHFTIDLKSGDGGRPAKIEWQASDLATAQQIVEDMYGDEFDVTYRYAS